MNKNRSTLVTRPRTSSRRAPSGALTAQRTAIAVLRAHGAWHLVALRAFAAGELVLRMAGELSEQPTRYSVQLGEAQHVDIPDAERGDLERTFDRYPWRFLNHSCAPSARIEGRKLLAAREIAPWEEITFDYNTTEDDMASPFVCRCGHCDGRRIAGFRNLTRAEQERLRPNLAPHLRRRLDSQAG